MFSKKIEKCSDRYALKTGTPVGRPYSAFNLMVPMHRLTIITVLTLLVFGWTVPTVPAQPADTDPEAETQAGPESEETEAKPNPYFERLAPPDRTSLRRFEQARRLIEAQRTAEAAQLLGAILEGPVDFFVAPPLGEEKEPPPNAVRTTGTLFGDLVLETLLGLPGKARESYALQFETQARRLLENAVAEGSVEGVQYVAKRYFPTSAGATAMFLLGTDQMDRAAFESAALTFDRLFRSRHDLTEFEPTLSLSLALCRIRLGQKDEARKTADALLQRHREPEILLFGKEPWKPKTTDEILDRLEKLAGSPVSSASWLERTGWLLGAGLPSQNVDTEARKPLLELLWCVSSLSKTIHQREARNLTGSMSRDRTVFLPATQPLVVGDRLVARGLGELMAVDVETGKLLWTAPEPEYRIAQTVRLPFRHNQAWRVGGNDAALSLRLHFWHDRITQQLSSDGTQVFSIDGHNLRAISFAAWGQGGGNLQIGRKTVEDPRNGPGTTLVSRDAATGRILWQVGKFPYVQKFFDQFTEDAEQEAAQRKAAAEKKDAPKPPDDRAANRPDRNFTEEERFLGETWFLGAPLPLEGRLYTIGENGGLLRLIVLDAQNGSLIRQVPIAVPPSSFESDPIRKFFGLIPSASSGVVVCPTALGMVVALDATTATPLWCFSYLEPTANATENRNRRNMQNLPFRIGGGDDFRNFFTTGGWQSPSIMIHGNRVLVAPPEDPALYCLELATGRLHWKNDRIKREHALYVACIRDGKAFVVTPRCMIAFDLETGRTVWDDVDAEKTDENALPRLALPRVAFPESLKPGGVGVHGDGLYFLPLSNGCLGVIDLDRAEIDVMTTGSQPIKPLVETASETESMNIDFSQGVGIEEQLLMIDPKPPVWTPPGSISTRSEIPLGNLVGIRGRFFSQTPSQIAGFDQWAPLERRAEALLAANAEDPEGLIALGRIRRAENNRAEAVDLFRRAVRAAEGAGGDEYAVDCLRKTLLEAVRDDYAVWAPAAAELEALAEFPEELGEILYVIARGAMHGGDGDRFLDAVRKAVSLEIDHSIPVPVESDHRTQLHRALGILVGDLARKSKTAPEFLALQDAAETIFQGLYEKKNVDDFLPKLRLKDAGTAKNRFLLRPWWERETTGMSSEARRWQVFTELFRPLPVADRADKILGDYYRRNRLFAEWEMTVNPPVDWMLPEKFFDVSTATEEPVTTKPRPVSPTAPPWLPPKSANPDDLKRLAGDLLEQDNPVDALYYVRQLENRAGNEEFTRNFLQRPEVGKQLDRLRVAADWPTGKVTVEDEPQTQTTPDTQNPRGAAIASVLRGTQRQGRFQANRRALPLFGSYEPFLSPFSYFLETESNEVHLVCADSLGGPCWRLRLSTLIADLAEHAYFSENHIYSILGAADQTVYLKGCNHLLLFVRDGEMVALDTFRLDAEKSPRVLWTKSIPTRIPCRQMYSAFPMSSHQAYSAQPNLGFPKESLFVGPEVVCYRDTDRVVGLDPFTGQELWSRDMPSSHCSILGDRENLFLVFPDIHQAIAVDPRNGRELAAGTIPAGGFFTFGPNIIFVKYLSPVDSPNQSRPYQLHVGDLRELYQKRRLALRISGDTVPGGIPTLPTYPIREDLTHEAMIRQFYHGRFLASISWTTKTLQIYDLETKMDVLGPEGDWGRRTGVRLPESAIRENRRRHDCDFDVELVQDKFLVYFIEKGEVNTQMKNELNENGNPVRRRRSAVNNLPSRNFGRGFLMLYESDGREAWAGPTLLEDWYRMLRTPEGLPVALFAVSMTEQEGRVSQNNLYTGLCGIDKRTGQTRFRCWIPPLPPNLQQTMLQGFYVQADPWKKQLAFVTPYRTVLAKFTDEKAGPRPEPVEEKPKPNVFDRIFDLFGE